MSYAQAIALLPSSGYSRSGSGLPVRIGRNSSISLDIAIANASSDATATIIIETSSYAVRERDRNAVTWRQLGASIVLVGNESSSITLTNADAFVRARYVVGGGPVSITCEGLARCVLFAPQTFVLGGVSTPVNDAQYHGGRFVVDVETAPMGQTLTLSIERSGDGITWQAVELGHTVNSFYVPSSWAAITAAGQYAVETADLDKYVRVRWSFGAGQGGWVFGVSGKLSLIFARKRDQLLNGIRSAAIPGATAEKYLAALERGTEDIVEVLTAFVMPLRDWSDSVRAHCRTLAEWYLLINEGEEPQGGVYSTARNETRIWMANVGGYNPDRPGRHVRPDVIDSTPPDADGTRAAYTFVSDPLRDNSSSEYVY